MNEICQKMIAQGGGGILIDDAPAVLSMAIVQEEGDADLSMALGPGAQSTRWGVCLPNQNAEGNWDYYWQAINNDKLGYWANGAAYKPWWYDHKHDAYGWSNTTDAGKMYVPMQYKLASSESNYAAFVAKLATHPNKVVLIGNEPEDAGGGGYLSAANFVNNMDALAQTLGFAPKWVGPNVKWTVEGQAYLDYLIDNLTVMPQAWGIHLYLSDMQRTSQPDITADFYNSIYYMRLWLVNHGAPNDGTIYTPKIWITETSWGGDVGPTIQGRTVTAMEFTLFAMNNSLERVFWFASNATNAYCPWGDDSALLKTPYTDGRTAIGDLWRAAFADWVDSL